jgi:hypothetical protein
MLELEFTLEVESGKSKSTLLKRINKKTRETSTPNQNQNLRGGNL